MTSRIVNQDAILVKSKAHRITRAGLHTFDVLSGNSGTTYTVILRPEYQDGAVRYRSGMCDCPWGTKGGTTVRPQSGCSHVTKVLAHIEAEKGRTVSAWGSSADARRQRRPIVAAGDGMLLTSRKNGNGGKRC